MNGCEGAMKVAILPDAQFHRVRETGEIRPVG